MAKTLSMRVPPSGLCVILLAVSIASADAQVTAEPKRTGVKTQTTNPTIRTNVIPSDRIKPLEIDPAITYLSKQDYSAALRQHDMRVQGLAAKANTRVRRQTSTQNHAFSGMRDCDDDNPQINPGAGEVCDGLDNDCDGKVDEGVSRRHFLDADGDGWGDPERDLLVCAGTEGYSVRANDCDDTSLQIYPGAFDRTGNGIDENCDGRDG